MKTAISTLALLICSISFANNASTTANDPEVKTSSSTRMESTTTTVTTGAPSKIPARPKSPMAKRPKATNGYEFKFDITLDGKPASKPVIRTKAGELATFEVKQPNGDKTTIELTANDETMDGKNGIMMNLVIGSLSKTGNKTVIANPKLMVFDDNEGAEIAIGSQKPGQADIQIKVTAKRKSL